MIKFSHDSKTQYCSPGGGTPIFKKEYVNYLLNYLPKSNIRISVGCGPTTSPHFGTMITFSVAFSLAKRIKEFGKNVEVMVGLVDTIALTSNKFFFENIQYQKSIGHTGEVNNYMDDYKKLLENLSSYSGVNYKIINQSEIGLHEKAPTIIKKIINEREKIGHLLSPETKCLALRSACPQCGLADQYGIKNHYEEDIINFFCPEHGWHSLNINKDNLQKLEYETPLRNLIRGLLYTEDNQAENLPYSWLRVTGSDHAGFFQEQLFYKGATMLGSDIVNSPMIVYSPLVVDWSGVKLSKSVFIEGEYEYLTKQGLDYLIDYRKLKVKFGNKGLEKLFNEVDSWSEESHKLFRNYTIFYFDELFKQLKVESLEKEQSEKQQAQIEILPNK